jgi:hypothetical protein
MQTRRTVGDTSHWKTQEFCGFASIARLHTKEVSKMWFDIEKIKQATRKSEGEEMYPKKHKQLSHRGWCKHIKK